MPATAALTATELASLEPKDKTSDEWRMWKKEYEAALRAENGQPSEPLPPAAPPAPPPPLSAEAAPAAAPIPLPSLDPSRRILNPVEFATLVLTRNPRDILSYQGRNSVARLAGDMKTLYESYLSIASPRYLAHVRAIESKKAPLERENFPDMGTFERAYLIATGA